MAEITWIKLKTDMFDDEKIKLIERMPEGDGILIIWVKLLAYAGKVNCSGYIMIAEDIPMNIEEMAIIFNRPLEKVRYAIQVLQRYRMIEVDEDERICISNWEKHQNIDGMEKVRLQTAERNRKYRERKKQQALQAPEPSHINESNVSVTSHDGTDIDKELDIDIDIDIENKDTMSGKPANVSLPYQTIIDYLNQKVGTKYKATSKKTQDLIKARFNDGFTIEDFNRVIDIKTTTWLHDPKMNKFLRPETLFGPKFEGYLNEKVGGNNATNRNAREVRQYDDGINF